MHARKRRGIAALALAVACCCLLSEAALAAFPGNNGKLAFVSARNGFPADSDLYTMNADGTSQTRITSLNQDELYPSWSSNGAKIVFQQDPGLGGEIWVANADGSAQQRLTDNSANDVHPAFSPDGTKIVFASDRDGSANAPDLFVMNADGSGQVNITNTPAIAEDYPAWSPDGSKLAFARDGDIYTAAPDGSSLTPLTQTPEIDVEPDWSPGGTQIAYHAGVASNDEIWKMNADGSQKTNLTNNGAIVDERPAWAPAGDKIAFTRNAFNNAEVYVMNTDGSAQTRITNNTVIDSHPAWQPLPAPGTVTVRLDAVPNDPQDFAYTANGLPDSLASPPTTGPTQFSLDDDADPALSNQRTFTGVMPGGGYSVTQAAVPGWDTTATCSDGSSPGAINVSSGEHVTCTFTNQKRGQIVVVLDTVPNDPQDFGFTAGGGLSPTTFQLDDDSDGTLSNTRTFAGVPAGSGYSVAQQAMPPGGWAQASATCSDGSPVSNVSVSAGETVTCTFTNRQPGHIAVVVDAEPNDAQDFAFTAGGGLSPASFQLDDDADSALQRVRTFDVTAGSGYSIVQTVPAGWRLGDARCDDGSPLANITVSANETVICTFKYLKHGQLTLVTDAQPDDAQDFSFTAGGGLSPTSFQLDDDSNATLSNTRTFASVPPGTGYWIADVVPAGWDQISATCSDDSLLSNIQVSAGESITCTVTNRKRGRVVVVQDSVPNSAQDFSFSAGGGLSPTSFQLDDDSDATLSNTRTYDNLEPRAGYSVSQSAPPSGWDLVSTSCDDGSPASDIDVEAGETVTCTFTDHRRASLTIAMDAQPNDAQDFSFVVGGGLSPANFQLDDDSDPALSNTRLYSSLNAGTYSATETPVPAGWDLAGATCSDGSPVSAIAIGIGEDVTCTFTNRKRGQLVVVKDAQPNDPQDFSFTAGGGLSPTAFQLDDDADAALSNTQVFSSVAAGSGYSVSEAAPAGWTQSSATCSDGSPIANIDIAPGELVTCTFTSQKRGSITVVKDATPNSAQDFSFTAGGGLSPATFSLDDDANATLSNTRAFNDVAPGSGYSVAETVPGGWDQTSATCDDGSPVTNIAVGPGEHVTCTFANRQRGRIVVVKDATPDDPQDFAFTAGGGLSPATFSLDDDANATLANTRSFDDVVPGSGYSLSESVPTGWDQTAATCNDGSPVTNINVAAGETVTCTFSNRKRATLVVVKDATPDDPQDFAFTAGGGLSPATFSLDDDANATLSNSRTFANVVPGAYSVTETVPAGWAQTGATCTDGSAVGNVALSAGETVTCTFANTKQGRITVVKDATPDSAQDFSFTAGGGLSPASFSLDDDANATLSNTRTFSDVAPGAGYSLAETVPGGWAQTSATCDDGSPVSNINVAPGEAVTCTFANRQFGKVIVVEDAVPNDAQDFSYTAGGGLSPTSFSLDDDSDSTLGNSRTFNDVVPGSSYSLSNTAPSGWNLRSATCDDGSPVSAIAVAAGETVTCTFTHEKHGSIVVRKQAQPSDGQDFTFAAGGGLSPTSFQLDDDTDPALSNTRTFGSLTPRSGYSVSETLPGGWVQVSATCDDGSPVTNVDVAPGETVTCTFSNRKPSRIVVVQDSQPDDPQNFSFTAGGGLSPTTFDLDDDADATLPRSRAFEDVTPGAGYSLTQAVPVGWLQIRATCSDGSPVSNVDVALGETVTCTFVNQRGYVRPRGATPVRASLVPAYNACTSPNRVHGPSLASPSCNPPAQSSPHLTVGTPDANGPAARMTGSVQFSAVLGDPGTPTDEADVGIVARVTDVRRRSDLTDYSGELRGQVVLRITDRLSGPGGNEVATASDVPFAFTIPCAGTTGTEGSTCVLVTSADAVLPGAVTELKRSIWQMSDVVVADGGPDGQASTADNSTFLRQGIFVP